jgi:hypothetical protein
MDLEDVCSSGFWVRGSWFVFRFDGCGLETARLLAGQENCHVTKRAAEVRSL